MKKKLIYFTSLLVIASVAISCGKTNKRKLSNDWTVSSMYQEVEFKSYEDSEDYKENRESESTTTIEDGKYVYKWSFDNESSFYVPGIDDWQTNTNSGDDKEEGDVLVYDFKITKDGNWERHFVLKQEGPNNSTIEMEQKETGTWSFVKKSEEFIKNERVLFNVLTAEETHTFTDEDGESNVDKESWTYKSGENTNVYVVKESTKDELSLMMEGETVNVFEDGGSTRTTSVLINLVAVD